jgi:hypothetical protein
MGVSEILTPARSSSLATDLAARIGAYYFAHESNHFP